MKRFVGCFWFLMLACAVGAEKYEVRFERASRVGDVENFKMSGAEMAEMVTTLDGELQEVDRTDELTEAECKWTTLKVDDEGKELEGEVLLKWVKYRSGGGQPLKEIAKDVVLQVKDLEDGLEFYQDGKPVEGQLRDALELCVPSMVDDEEDEEEDDAENQSMDDLFGTKEAKAVGDSWVFDREAFLADSPKELKGAMDLKSLKGEVKFVELVEVEGVECMRLVADVSCDLTALPGLDEGVTIKKGTALKLKIEAMLPVDLNRPERTVKVTYLLENDLEMKHPAGVLGMVGKHENFMTFELIDFKRG